MFAVRPSTVRAVADRQAQAEGLAPQTFVAGEGGAARVDGRASPAESQAAGTRGRDAGEDGCRDGGGAEGAEVAVAVLARLYAGLVEAGPVLRQCCPEAPVQGLLFDHRNAPTRAVEGLPCVTVLRDGRLVDVEGGAVGRDLGVDNPMVMLAQAERALGGGGGGGGGGYLFIEDVLYGDDPKLRPMLIEEVCTLGAASGTCAHLNG